MEYHSFKRSINNFFCETILTENVLTWTPSLTSSSLSFARRFAFRSPVKTREVVRGLDEASICDVTVGVVDVDDVTVCAGISSFGSQSPNFSTISFSPLTVRFSLSLSSASFWGSSLSSFSSISWKWTWIDLTYFCNLIRWIIKSHLLSIFMVKLFKRPKTTHLLFC